MVATTAAAVVPPASPIYSLQVPINPPSFMLNFRTFALLVALFFYLLTCV